MGMRKIAAFTFLDLVVCIASVGIVLALATTGLSGSRHAGNEAVCTSRLGAIGAGNAQFALSNNGLMVGLTWQQGGNNSQYPDLNGLQGTPGTGPHAAQAIDILRRRGRPDIPPISAWIADIGYWSLALADFQNRPLTDAFNVCPSHDNLNKWRRHPAAFDMGRFTPGQPPPSPTNRRWPYTSSYTLTGSAFDVNQTVLTTPAAAARLSNSQTHAMYFVPGNAVLGPSDMSLVAFPAQKVHVFDSHQRHRPGVHLYFGYAAAEQPILFFDGGVSVRVSGQSLVPWQPNLPNQPNSPQQYQYQPMAWEAPTQNGQSSQLVFDRYRWTRDGLMGRDYAN